METTLFDSQNPIMEWLNKSITEYETNMDERANPPTPSRVVIDEVRLAKSSDALLDKPIKLWVSKRKRPNGGRKEKKKKGKKAVADEEEEIVGSDDDKDTPPNSLDYAESQDSSSLEEEDAHDDIGNDGLDSTKGRVQRGEQYVKATESQAVNLQLPLQFSKEDHFTHTMQDADHGSRQSRLCKKKDISSLY